MARSADFAASARALARGRGMNFNKVILKFVSISFSVLITLLVIVGLVELGTNCYRFGYRVFTEPPMDEAPGRDVSVMITSDMSEYDIGRELQDRGLVRDAALFLVQLKLSAYSGDIRPGSYTLNTSLTGKELAAAMAATKEDAEGTEGTESKEGGT